LKIKYHQYSITELDHTVVEKEKKTKLQIIKRTHEGCELGKMSSVHMLVSLTVLAMTQVSEQSDVAPLREECSSSQF
jgi:hypothetical protein